MFNLTKKASALEHGFRSYRRSGSLSGTAPAAYGQDEAGGGSNRDGFTY